MNTSRKLSGFALASAAAFMLSACGNEAGDAAAPAGAESAATEATVHCSGINACKGQSACTTATSACKSQNACKGQGWIEKTQAECDTAGGKVS